MSLRISGKNVDVGEALRSRVTDRIGEAVEKYFDGGFSGLVVFEREGAFFRCECTIHLDTGIVLQATGSGTEPTLTFDQAAERIEKRLRRYKRRLKGHDRDNGRGNSQIEAMSYVLAAPEEEELPEDFKPLVIAENPTPLKTMTVGMAVMHLDLCEAPVVVFRSAAHGGINVVYRRPDGNIGWVDPALVESAAA